MVAKAFRAALWSAIAVTLLLAWMPAPPTILHNDKMEHGLAFALLAPLFVAAYPRARYGFIFMILAALGALIEIGQAIPALHRDCDIHDWYADIAAIGVGLLIAGSMKYLAKHSGRLAC
jgi:hypothetical protein